jgi:hypothetical protein
MKKVLNFFAHLQFIFKPSYWFMVGKYDKSWDKTLQQLAKEHDFVPIYIENDMTCRWTSLGDEHMWVGNYPFSFFTKETIREVIRIRGNENVYFYELRDPDTQSRPSRLTIHRLRNKVVADLLKHNVTIPQT